MPTVYLNQQHSFVRKDGDSLVVHPAKDGDGTASKVRIPLIKIEHVVVEGDVTLTTPALAALLENNVEVSFLSYYGNYRGTVVTPKGRDALAG